MRGFVIFAALALAAYSAEISDNCLDCICQVLGCHDNLERCNWDVNSYSCGPFQIKEPYYIDCYQPGTDWLSCTKQMSCSMTCVRSYMKRYGTYCTRGRQPTCKDYATMHFGGPRGCRYKLESWWSPVRSCCDRKPGGCD